jgi:hypothetical protein
MSQRYIVKIENTYPWEGVEITTNTTLTGADAPPISIRKKAANNAWWIEKKVYAPGTSKAGTTYWQFVKDPSSVSNLVNTGASKTKVNIKSNPTTPPKPVASPKVKVTVWGKRNWSEESSKYQKRSTKELLFPETKPTLVPDSNSTDEEIVNFINDCIKYKPVFMEMSEIKWKLLVRTSLRGDNAIILGDKGEGKTMVAHALANSLNRPLFSVNFGHMQDAQTALIGKTHLDTKKGTFFSKSYFVEAITTPNAIVLMDELSRASDDAFNIVMPVLDKNQRYLRLNDEVNAPKVEVAQGVCFIATANVGHEYSATRDLDAALSDRYTTKIEIDRLTIKQRVKIMGSMFPVIDDKVLTKIANVANDINSKVYSGEGELTKPLSTRTCISIASLIHDGIEILESVENTIYTDYKEESERTYLKQLVQGYKFNEYAKSERVFKSQEQSEIEVDA